MKRYLVTGGTGFIGSAVVRRLVADGHQVTVVDNNLRGNSRRLADIAQAITIGECDVRDSAALRRFARGCDGVLHLASVNGTENFYRRPELVLDVGVRGMLSVIDVCRAEGIGELLLTSSSEAYQNPPVIPTPETVPLVIPDPRNPRYSYAAQKLISEVILFNYTLSGFHHVVVIRPHNVYGPDMGWGHVIPAFVSRLAASVKGLPDGVAAAFELQGDGSQTRAFCHIDDFVDGLMLALHGGGHREIYHIGNDEEVTIEALARSVARCMGHQIELHATPLLEGSPPRRCPAIDKLRALGYRPRISLERGLPEVVDWYLQHLEEMPAPGALV